MEILQAAERIFSEKRLEQASISEIAQMAKVPDSTIYQYFKGKEDLLFSVAGERLNEALLLLLEHLEGIEDPVSRLRKMIWFNLNYNDTHRDYARLLLMECRYSVNFYRHEAYSSVRKYAKVLIEILHSGVSKGVFRSGVNMRLVRDIIFGLLDWEKVSALAMGELNETVTDFEQILSLLLPMILQPAGVEKEEKDKATRILEAAIKAFAESGYSQTTISQIARLANVAGGTVYEYFKNKEDLLLSIPYYRYQSHIEKLPGLFKIQTPLEKLQHLIRYYFFMHLNERDFLKVFLFHIQYNERFYGSPGYQTFRRYIDVVIDILEQGKKDGSIRSDVNSRVFRNLFMGVFSHVSLRWLLKEDTEMTDKMQEVGEIATLLCQAVAVNGWEQL